MSTTKRLALAIVQFLAEQRQFGNLSSDAQESLEVAVQCLETAFELTPEDAATLSVSKPLLDIFEDVVAQENGTLPAEATAEDKAKAEGLKNEGNNLMKSEKFNEAIELYTKAIQLDGRNAVYYCNRAAAFSKLNSHQAAIEDCRKAILIDPNYSKAYGRMGLAFASLNNHMEAVACYKRALELEPDNESYQNNLAIAEEKLKQESPGLGGRVPGMPFDLGNVLNNPGLMNMAQQMLSNPNMQQLMNQIMSGVAGPAPGQPGGLDALLQVGQQLAQQIQESNPELVDQLRRQMGGGADPSGDSGSNPPGSS